ncbi:MAG: ATP-binding protein [Anaerolineae bacterium]|nr:ATP-binding protein [Anaerolineae bacterium]
MALDTYGRLSIRPETFIGESVAVLGIKGSGKSNTGAVLMEECLDLGLPIIVVDLEGEYYTLKDAYPNVAIVGNSLECKVDMPLTDDNAREVGVKAYRNGMSVVVDLSGEPTENHEGLIQRMFVGIWDAAKVARIPAVIFLEECHNWIPQAGKTGVSGIFVRIATRGRKRGLSLVMMSQRSSMVDKNVLTQADICFLHKVRHPADLDVYKGLIPRDNKWVTEKVSKLKTGEVLLLKGETVMAHQIRLQKTRHAGATPTIAKVPVTQMSLMDLMAAKYD